MKTLQGIGWQWRTDGVVVCLQIDGQQYSVLMPLRNVWHEFAKELAAVGAPLPPSVGGACTVSGLFSGIAHAVSSVAHAVTHNAITKAAGNVVHAAVNVALHNPITNAVSRVVNAIPIIGPLAKSVATLVTAPINAVDSLANGGRIDRVAMNTLKSSLAGVKGIAPYAQTVLSLVPGVGQGLSGAIGAGLALASGQNITSALMAGVRGALPGGPLAAAAFDVASAAMAGKPITQIALNALPIAPAQKQALVQGVQLARDLANGKKVSQALIDTATHALPPDLQKAVQIGAALAHASSLQNAVSTLAQGASLATQVANGVQAAQMIRALPPHAPVPPAVTAAVKAGLQAHAVTSQIVAHAAAGHPGAASLVAAMHLHAASNPPNKAFRASYHTAGQSVGAPLHHGGGIHSRFGGPRTVSMANHAGFKARYHTHPAVRNTHVGAPWHRHQFFQALHHHLAR